VKRRAKKLRIRDPREVMGHSCIDLSWKDMERGEYDYLPSFLEC